MQKEPSGPLRRPLVVAVMGLKNSGKTTVAEGLISGLSARGLRVAAIKTSHLARLDLDPAGRDSRRLYDAGAVFVMAQGQGETLTVRRHERPTPFSELLRLVPAETDVVVTEGGAAAAADVILVCLRALDEMEETLKVRTVPLDRVRALTGLAAAGASGARGTPRTPGAAGGAAAHLPLLDAAAPAGRAALTALVLEAAGRQPAPTSDPRTS